MKQQIEGKSPAGRSRRAVRTVAGYAVLIGLLYFALRNAPFAEIWTTLQNLRPWQIGAILSLNAFVIICMAARWWIIVRAENPSVPFLPMIGYRLSVFGVSYFTPGPQVGGEPLQVIFLQRNHGITFARATSAVIMDKLLEFLINFVLIGIGTWAIIREGIFTGDGIKFTLSLIGLGVLLTLPLVQFILLYSGYHPITGILVRLRFIRETSSLVRTIIVAERMASAFCRRHLRSLVPALLASLAAMAGIVAEYYLMVHFLGMQITPTQILAALTAMQIAFLIPLPGGLGALEASQVFTLGAFGEPAAAAISLTLLMRARDILNGGIGLLLAGRSVTR